MNENQAEFRGWAKVEVMGHQSHTGYVTTEAYGQAVLFRIDRPEMPEMEETLERSEWIGDKHCGVGSVVKRGAVEALTVLVGSGSIYRIIPCSEAVAIRAIRESERRPHSIVKMADLPALTAARSDDDPDLYEDEEKPF